MPAFWTIASLMSITVNIVLIVILFVMFQMLGAVQGTANDQVSGLLGGLYTQLCENGPGKHSDEHPLWMQKSRSV